MVQEEHALPHDRRRTGGMSFVVVVHGWQRGRGSGAPGIAASLCPLLVVLDQDMCCMLVWDARPLISTLCPSLPGQ